MKITFLGTASCFPTVARGVSCTAIQHENGQIWLFDCGEGTQVQLQRSSLKVGKINKIFITHLHGDHVFGLPGLLCSLGNGLNSTALDEKIVDIYGPLGIRKFVSTCLEISKSPTLFEYRIHELQPVPDQYPDDWADCPTDFDFPWALKNEILHRQIPVSFDKEDNGFWPVYSDHRIRVVAAGLEHRLPCFGYVVTEADQPGSLDAAKLKSVGLKPGPEYGLLKRGESVTVNGKTIRPEDVTGATKRGRKVVMLGDTRKSDGIKPFAMDADLLVHEATMSDDLVVKAIEYGHSTPSMAAAFAADIRAKRLCLTHVSPRYKPVSTSGDDSGKKDSQSAQILLDEARAKIAEIEANCIVTLAEDFHEEIVPYPTEKN